MVIISISPFLQQNLGGPSLEKEETSDIRRGIHMRIYFSSDS